MRGTILAALSLVVLTTPVSGVRAQTLRCHGAQQPRLVAELVFGRAVGGRLRVSEKSWARFVVREMTPRFPDGLTVTEAIGQWHDRDSNTILREPSKRVEIVLPGKDDDESNLEAVVAAFEHQFHQQSVLTIVRPACVSF